MQSLLIHNQWLLAVNNCVTSNIISAAVFLSHITEEGISHRLDNLQRGRARVSLPLLWLVSRLCVSYDLLSALVSRLIDHNVHLY